MEKETIKFEEKTLEIRELLATEFDEISEIEDATKRIVEMVKISANLSDDDYKQVTVKERKKIIDTLNKLNGWTSTAFRESETKDINN